ncbi:hypothetical protein RATSFB_0582 [Candidatus Arthromitus sp. SFB-rat-Yit]|nr:hypothetical protein RATSFB_0582 [Candidatus Arthromitus sp. SFB-rat-Yit]
MRGLKYVEGWKEVLEFIVAPHAGAWIEIFIFLLLLLKYKSHLTQVRGLKC